MVTLCQKDILPLSSWIHCCGGLRFMVRKAQASGGDLLLNERSSPNTSEIKAPTLYRVAICSLVRHNPIKNKKWRKFLVFAVRLIGAGALIGAPLRLRSHKQYNYSWCVNVSARGCPQRIKPYHIQKELQEGSGCRLDNETWPTAFNQPLRSSWR